MNDLFPESLGQWRYVEACAARIFSRSGYGELRTPILEETGLFARSLGESTDVVGKEMYSFPDRKGKKSLSLRPEGTAGVVRAYVQHARYSNSALTRLWYHGPMFRHERVQAGRYRQFYQIGAEAFGSADPSLDVEMLSMLTRFFSELGLTELRLLINNLGDTEDRSRYQEVLVAYLNEQLSALCEDCQRRVQVNPLRTLDCKVPSCQPILEQAPAISEYVGEGARKHFEELCELLETLGIAWERKDRLVRGLDYYNRTCFEFVSGSLGAQNTVCGGGRYDGLVKQLGGPATPAVGFALGLERLVSLLPESPSGQLAALDPLVSMIPISSEVFPVCLRLVEALRGKGLRVDLDTRRGSLKSQMKRANKLGARLALVIGEDEVSKGVVAPKDMRAESDPIDPISIEALPNSLGPWLKEHP